MVSTGGVEILGIGEGKGCELNIHYSLFTSPTLTFLDLGLGLGKADRALTLLPLTALLEQLDTLETLEHGTLSAGST